MKLFSSPALAVGLALAGCHAAPPVVDERPAAPALLSQSSLAALVRVLEAVDAQRPAGALIEVRAVEGDSLRERTRQAEFVRLFLHVTVFSEGVERARAAFEELRLALEAEARSERRLESVSPGRIQRVFGELDWNPPGRNDLVSYSEAIRLEVAPGRAPASEAALASEPAGSAPATTAERYVDDIARSHAFSVHASAVHAQKPSEGVRELRCLLRPSAPDAHFTLAEIGAFLGDLEAGSPGARLTHLAIERCSALPDNLGDDAWSFEAELSVRGPTP